MASRQKSAPHTDESIFKAECKPRFWGAMVWFLLKHPSSRAFKSLLRDYTYHYLHVLQLTGSFISALTGAASKRWWKPCIHKSKPPSAQEPCSQHYVSIMGFFFSSTFSFFLPRIPSWNSRLTIAEESGFQTLRTLSHVTAMLPKLYSFSCCSI